MDKKEKLLNILEKGKLTRYSSNGVHKLYNNFEFNLTSDKGANVIEFNSLNEAFSIISCFIEQNKHNELKDYLIKILKSSPDSSEFKIKFLTV